MQDLTELNIKIGEHEKAQDVESLDGILIDGFVFRRASGELADRSAYLAAVPLRHYTELESTDVDIVYQDQEAAVVTLVVHAVGTNEHGDRFDGHFRNIRIWRHMAESGWRLELWANHKLATSLSNSDSDTNEPSVPLRSAGAMTSAEPWAEVYKALRAHELMLNQATAKFEHAVLAPLVVLNGGAVVAFLTLIGALAEEEPGLTLLQWVIASTAISAWTGGLVAAVVAVHHAAESQRLFSIFHRVEVREKFEKELFPTVLWPGTSGTDELDPLGNAKRRREKFMTARRTSVILFVVGALASLVAIVVVGEADRDSSQQGPRTSAAALSTPPTPAPPAWRSSARPVVVSTRRRPLERGHRARAQHQRHHVHDLRHAHPPEAQFPRSRAIGRARVPDRAVRGRSRPADPRGSLRRRGRHPRGRGPAAT